MCESERLCECVREMLFISDHKSVLRVSVGREEVRTLIEQSLDLLARRGCFFLIQHHGQHLGQLGHAVRECHQT